MYRFIYLLEIMALIGFGYWIYTVVKGEQQKNNNSKTTKTKKQ